MFNGDLMSEPTVRFHTVPLSNARGVLGVAVMDRPKALNALDHTMIRGLLQAVETVESDTTIKALWIESSAEKAFCAGGDVRDVTNNGQAGGLDDLSNSADYLADEYLLDVWLRYCSKPVFAWGDGYIMGGGMGVAGRRAPPPMSPVGRRSCAGLSVSMATAGFRMWKLHMSVSSMDMIAPALSNSPQ